MSPTKGPEQPATPPAQEPEQQRRHGDSPQDGQARRHAGTEREAREFAEQTGYRHSSNQGRDEPMPASRHDERRQEAVVRNEEHNDGQVRAAPSRRNEQRDRG